MQLSEYQKISESTAIYPQSVRLLYPTLGLAGEAGEIAEKVKKMLRDDGGELSEERRDSLILELGDVLWYLAAIARDLDIDLNLIAMRNIQKLERRQSQGKLTGDGDNR